MLGERLLSRLSALDNPLIREVRGRGLLAGIELDATKVQASVVVEKLLSAGILTKEAHRNTVRLAPPFVITETEIDWAVDRIAEVLAALSKEILEPIAAH
jgi:ornithine--oxo-acid transaminase